MRWLPLMLLLGGCANFTELGEQQQDAELENNRAEVIRAEREICRQARVEVLFEHYADRLDSWAAFCNHPGDER